MKSLDISRFEVKNITDMNQMFYKCNSLISLDISKWNVKNVTNLSKLFKDCNKLQSIGDTSKWNIENVKKMNKMFYNCKSLKSLDISKWDCRSLTDASYMFYNCENLVNLNIFPLNNKNINYNNIFFKCNKLKNLQKMVLNYKINKDIKEIRLFGGKFYLNNKHNCYILIEGKINKLKKKVILNENQKKFHISVVLFFCIIVIGSIFPFTYILLHFSIKTSGAPFVIAL